MKKRPILSIIYETFSYLDKETKLKSAFSASISMINALLEILVTLMAYPLVLSISNGKNLNLEKLTNAAPQWVQGFLNSEQTIFWSLCIVAVFVIKNIFFLFQNWWNFGFTRKSAARLSERLLNEYMRSPYIWHLSKNPTELHRNTNISVDSIFINIVIPTLNVLTELLLLIIMCVFVIAIEPLMFLLTIVFISISGITYTLLFGRISSNFGKQQELSIMQITKSLFHALGGLKEARILGRQAFLVDDYAKLRHNHAHIARVVSMIAVMPRAFLEIMLALVMLFGIIWITGNNNGDQSMAILGTFGVAAIRLMPAIGRILSFFHMARIGEASLSNIAPHLQSMSPNKNTNNISCYDTDQRPQFTKELNLNQVTFSYGDDTKPSLQGATLSIKKGQYIGLVGASGAGKSTLVDIILGVLPPQKGKVYLDNQDISGNPDIWNGMLGYVPQTIYLLDDTIERNIAFGLNLEDIDREQLLHAIKSAQLEEFVEGLELGIETIVGDRGVRLSGGQRQRIGIARALYGNPEILIMDEGTSALDGATEAKLTTAIEELRGNKTIILIAHRLSTIRFCDTIVVMDNGQITDMGNYETLIKKSSLFAEMVSHATLN